MKIGTISLFLISFVCAAEGFSPFDNIHRAQGRRRHFEGDGEANQMEHVHPEDYRHAASRKHHSHRGRDAHRPDAVNPKHFVARGHPEHRVPPKHFAHHIEDADGEHEECLDGCRCLKLHKHGHRDHGAMHRGGDYHEYRQDRRKDLEYDHIHNEREKAPRIPRREHSVLERPLPSVSISEVIERSRAFPLRPLTNVYKTEFLLKFGYPREGLRHNFDSFHVIVQENALNLISEYAKIIAENPNYQKIGINSTKKFIHRLITKRAMAFRSPKDVAVIVVPGKNGLKAYKSTNIWTTIGHRTEVYPFTLENCLSYDELRFSALLTFVSNTAFLNDGRRKNEGFVERDRNRIQTHGVIMGAVGPRLERERAMEHRDLFVPARRHHTSTVDRLFRDFYSSADCILSDIELFKHANRPTLTADWRMAAVGHEAPIGRFQRCAYRERLTLTFDPILLDANAQARNQGRVAVLKMTGLGLGVWKLYEEQTILYIDFFLERVRKLVSELTSIRAIHLDHIPNDFLPNVFEIGHIEVRFVESAPALRLAGDELLVYVFAGNSNSPGGNGFWLGDLSGSAEPAAAAFSQIAETFNPHINPRVGADSVFVATNGGAMVGLNEYLRRKRIQ